MSLHILKNRKVRISISILLMAAFSLGLYTLTTNYTTAKASEGDDHRNLRPIPPAEIDPTDVPVIGDVIRWVLSKFTNGETNNDSSNNSECDCGCASGGSCSC